MEGGSFFCSVEVLRTISATLLIQIRCYKGKFKSLDFVYENIQHTFTAEIPVQPEPLQVHQTFLVLK